MLLNIIKDLLTGSVEKESLWESMNPFDCIDPNDNSILWLKDGNCTKVIKLRGKEYGGLSLEKQDQLFNLRLEFLRQIDPDVIVTTHAQRDTEHYEINNESENEYVDQIVKKWNKNFEKSFKTYHYVVVTTTNLIGKSLTNRVENKLSKNYQHKVSTINKNCNSIASQLRDFETKILKEDSLLSFFTSYINGKKCHQRVPENKLLSNILAESSLLFPSDKSYMIYKNTKNIYSKWITIKIFDNEKFSSRLLEELLSYKAEFTIYQTFQKYTKAAALEQIQTKESNRSVNSSVASDLVEEELKEVRNNIEENNTFLYSYTFYIQVLNTDLKKLNKQTDEIRDMINIYGYRAVVENLNIEPLYWSVLPSYQKLNSVKRELLSQNICNLNTFTTVSQGLESCSWGETPVTKFKTLQNTNFDFTFHHSTSDKALGHTLALAGSEGGKTTLIAFLMMMSLHYKDLTIIGLDKLEGLYIWTKFLNGKYTDFDDDISLNPLQLEDTPANREFLKTFFQIMSKKDDAESTKRIDDAIRQVYEHTTKDKRNLEEFYLALGSKTSEDDVVSNIEPWIKGSNKRFFGSKKDSLSFENRINVFAMDTIFHNPDAPALVSLYMFQKIKQLGKPVLIFIDELVDYLKNEAFAGKILEILVEIRKKDGVLILAVQDYKFLINSEIGKLILGSSLANYLLFPEPANDEYKKALSLSDDEFDHITKSTDKRKILLKRVKQGNSTVLDVNLESLEQYLKIFNSSSTEVLKVKQLEEKYPNDWKERFLND